MSPTDDDDRTVIRPPSQRAAAAPLGHTLPLGTHLRDYEITGLIGEGGFGIVYLAWDHSLQRKVAIKEYMPASMASRVAGSSAIVVKSERHLDTFRAGLKSFVNEARLLARFDHPSLVKVYRFWEENGTAYMAMPFYEGPTLKTALAELGHVPTEAELRVWLAPLLDALTVMHAAQCFHRDIAPDNILLTATGPLLLDFGAARRVIGDMTHALTVVLKPGYAPIEQYGDVASMSQGAWTDLYALACVVYYAITGKTPMSSVERLMDDRMEPLAALAAGRYSDGFLRAIDRALAVRPQDRPQNEAQFRALLDAGLPPSTPAPTPSGYGTLSHEAFPVTEDRAYSTVPGTLTPELATQLLARSPEPPASVAPPPIDTPVERTELQARPAAVAPQEAARVAPSTSTARRRGLHLALAFVVAGAAVAGWALWQSQRTGEDHAAPAGPLPAASATLPAALAPSAPAPATTSASMPVVAAPALAAPSASSPTVAAPDSASLPASVPPSPVAETAPRATTPNAVVTPPVDATPPATQPQAPRNRRDATRPGAPVESRPAETRSIEARPAETRPAEPRRPSSGSRCSDILQKASLEPLTAEEAAYLKRECR